MFLKLGAFPLPGITVSAHKILPAFKHAPNSISSMEHFLTSPSWHHVFLLSTFMLSKSVVDKLAHRPIWPIMLLEHSHAHSFTYYLRLFSYYNGLKLSSYDRDHMVHKAKNIHYLVLYIKSFLTPNIDHTNQGRQIYITNCFNKKKIRNIDFCIIMLPSYNHQLMFTSILFLN